MSEEHVIRKPGYVLSRTKTSMTGMLNVLETAKTRTKEEKDHKRYMKKFETVVFCVLATLFEALMIIIYALWLKYEDPQKAAEDVITYYNYFRDVSVMIFFGFGFLMTFLRRGGYSAIGYTLIGSAMVVQWSVPINVLVDLDDSFGKAHPFGVYHLLNGLFCAAAVMISYGAVLGKVTPLQIILLCMLEPIFYWLNVYIGVNHLGCVDIGGGIFIHTFGCYFGLGVTWFLTSSSTKGHPDNTSSYSSDVFSMAGTVFLWIMWPSFNAAVAPPTGQDYAVINTFLSLTGSTVSTFVVSRIWSRTKIDPVHIQNSTLAGGVVMGTVAHLPFAPATAIGMGLLAGAISTTGYHFLTPWINNRFYIQDVCGVHNLHGMPGALGGIFSIFVVLIIDDEDYPKGDKQPGYQLAALAVSLGLGIVGGCITGCILWLAKRVYSVFAEDYFNDRTFWTLPSDYEHVIRDNSSPNLINTALKRSDSNVYGGDGDKKYGGSAV